MATLFTSVYLKFLAEIDDYELGLVSNDELNNICFNYLDKARAMYFPQCKKDLDDVTIQLQSEIDGLEPINAEVDRIVGQFNEDLTNREQYILALCMKKAWLSSRLYSADLMSKDVGDRDYKAVQGTPYLKELGNLDKSIEEEIHKYAVEYTYSLKDLSEGW